MTADTTSTVEHTFRLPDLGEGLAEGEIVRWLVAEGDQVEVDEPLVEVETAKSIVEVPSPFAGRVAILHAAEGASVDVGAALVTIESDTAPGDTGPGAESEDPASAASAAAESNGEEEKAGSGNVLIGYGTSEAGRRGRRRRPRTRSGAVESPASPAAGPSPDRETAEGRPDESATAEAASPTPEPVVQAANRRARSVASPVVRRLARDGGVDLTEVVATGKDGLITRSDVVRALAARTAGADERHDSDPRATGTGERRTPLNGFRKAVAAQLSRSRSEIPEATVWVDIDATPLWELRESTRTPDDPGPSLLAYLGRFVVAGLKRYPVLNAHLDVERQEIVEHDHIHLGLATQSPRGLVVPAVMNAETLTTEQLSSAIQDVVARAREGKATTEELAAGTFTLNNYGSFRVDGSAPIINHPQVAILGFGRILDRPWVVDGEICVRKLTQMSFAFDHRVCDGATAAGFMRVVADAIENPAATIRNM